VFRHVSKAAGTTVRFLFDKQVAMGDFEFLPMCHYGFREKDWREVVTRFKDAAVDPARIASGEGPRIIVEIRNEWGATDAFENVVMKDLKELRATHSHLGCEISSSVLLRDPTAQYRSFYEYYIRPEQDGAGPNQGKPLWGDGFAEWASRVPDVQTRELLGDRCMAGRDATAGLRRRRIDQARGPDPRRDVQGDAQRQGAIREAGEGDRRRGSRRGVRFVLASLGGRRRVSAPGVRSIQHEGTPRRGAATEHGAFRAG
jgi:hypothetical protein